MLRQLCWEVHAKFRMFLCLSVPAFTSCRTFLWLPGEQPPNEPVICKELGLSLLLSVRIYTDSLLGISVGLGSFRVFLFLSKEDWLTLNQRCVVDFSIPSLGISLFNFRLAEGCASSTVSFPRNLLPLPLVLKGVLPCALCLCSLPPAAKWLLSHEQPHPGGTAAYQYSFWERMETVLERTSSVPIVLTWRSAVFHE